MDCRSQFILQTKVYKHIGKGVPHLQIFACLFLFFDVLLPRLVENALISRQGAVVQYKKTCWD